MGLGARIPTSLSFLTTENTAGTRRVAEIIAEKFKPR